MCQRASGPENGFLSGNGVYLRPVEPGDLDTIMTWVNSPWIRGLIGSVFPMSRAGVRKWLDKVEEDKDRVWFAVVHRDCDRLIGEAGLLRIFHPWRAADCSVIIGDRGAWGQGHGTEAARLLIDYAFGSLNLNRLSVWVAGSNPRAVAWWRRMGFRDEGVARQAYYLDGTYHDFIIMGLLAQEWRRP